MRLSGCCLEGRTIGGTADERPFVVASDVRAASGCEADGSTQVEGHAQKFEMQGVAVEPEVADTAIAVAPLEGGEDMLDGGADGSDQAIAPLLPMRQLGLVLVTPVHDAVLDAERLEPAPSLLVLVGAVGIDRFSVPAVQVSA